MEQIDRTVVTAVADIFGVPRALVLIVGMMLATLCGVLAYRFAKAFLALIAADFGFFVGAQLYYAVQTETMPDEACYVFGLAIAVFFFWLSFDRASYVWYAMVAMIGYSVTRFYLLDNFWIALGGALVLAMLSIAFFRIAYIVFTSFGSSVLCMGFLSALLPNVAFLRLQPRNFAFWGCVGILSLIFLAAQYTIFYCKKKQRSI